MRPRLPYLIWRSIFGELVRVLFVTSVSLLAVIAFAGAIKPLAEGQIGLGDALMLTALLSVPMLQFALPFAAGFASTMSYHRMASDNETIAAASGGVSHRAIMVPAAAVGLTLAVGLAFLANDVIPSFLRRAERVMHRDIARLLVAPIERGMPIHFPDWGVDIYAEEVRSDLEPPAGSGALEVIALFKVLAVQRRDDGQAAGYYSAERADVFLFADPEDPGATAVQLVLTGATTNSAEGSGWQRTGSTNRIRIPSRIEDDPKFLSFAELVELRDEPRRMRAVEDRARRLIASFSEEEMIDVLRESLERTGQATFRLRERLLTLSAGGLDRSDRGWFAVPSSAGGRVTISLTEPTRTQWAERAEFVFSDSGEAGRKFTGGGAARSLELRLEQVVTETGDGGVELAEQRYSALVPLGFNAARWDEASVGRLLDEAERRAIDGSTLREEIRKGAGKLEDRTEELRREIKSKIHERVAYSSACLVMVITGAVVALRMRESLPLPVYLWSFFPALLAVITISTGQRMIHRHGDMGLLVLWGGVAALAVYTFMGFFRLRRH